MVIFPVNLRTSDSKLYLRSPSVRTQTITRYATVLLRYYKPSPERFDKIGRAQIFVNGYIVIVSRSTEQMPGDDGTQ